MSIFEDANEHSLIEAFAVAAENFASALTNGASARRVVAVRGKGLDGPADEIKRLGSR